MSKLETPFNNQQNSQSNSPNQNNSANQSNSAESQSQEPSLMNILVAALAPLIPVVLAQMTGQKLPSINTTPDNQNANQQLTLGLQTIISNQTIIFQELAALKNNAQIIANNFQSLRLTHQTEKKQLEFNTNKNLEEYEN